MSLRKLRGEVGEGGPCVSVLLFRGGGGGGKMAAHGGSAASSALKGLIQQFTAITGKRRGYRKVESGVWSGRPVHPRLPLTFMHSSFGLFPIARVLPPEEERRRRRVSGSGGRLPSPHHVSQSLVLGLLVVWRGTPPRFCQLRPREWAEPFRPRRPRDLGAGMVGGRTRATALLLHRHLFSVQPWGAVHPLTSFFLSSSARSFSAVPGLPFPFLGPLEP